MSSIVECIKSNDKDLLRRIIAYQFSEWAEAIDRIDSQIFYSAQEMFDFLLVDWMTKYYYGLQQEPDIQRKFLLNLKHIVRDLELYNGKIDD